MACIFTCDAGTRVYIDRFWENRRRLSINFSVQAYSYFHILFLLIGTRQVLKGDKIPSQNYWILSLLIIGVSLAVTFSFYNDPAPSLGRYFLRLGFKNLITSISFIAAGVMLFRKVVLGHGIGHRMLFGSLILFGLVQAYYFMVVLVNVTGGKFPIPVFFGIADLLMMSCIGLSMIISLLEDERNKLKKANRELDNFLYRSSHDLRSPIASVLGLTSVAMIEMQEPKSLEVMAMIEGRVKKLDLIIADILDLSRSTKAQLKIEKIDFNVLMEDILSDIRFNKNSDAILFLYDPNLINIFFADYSQMKIVMSNLVHNAVKYHRTDQPNPFISVDFKKKGEQVIISISDNGQGIEVKHQPKVFEMFYSASTNSDGTGLGLYMVKEVLNKINGSIHLKSERGEGSTFTITLDQSRFID
ncbi:MAG: HAMP domain-containing histidine kinase [Bacteroidia bacterium]|nr:HAMP domain-containing histidine kinase [Bacteroidia bacterium]